MPVNPYQPPLASTNPLDDEFNGGQWVARRRGGGFLRQRCEVTDAAGKLAVLVGGILTERGTIQDGDQTFCVDRSRMTSGQEELVRHRIVNRIWGATFVELTELSSDRTFRLQQQQIWPSCFIN